MKLFYLLVLAATATASPIVRRENGQNSTTGGVVASNFAECSDTGVDILKQGGNAADAIIATCLCAGVIGGYASGIGGGGYMLVRNASSSASKKYEMIDFRETMPAAGNETMYSNNTDKTASTIGGLSIGVPGELRGLGSLHQRHGRLPWPTLFKSAINYARNGFTLHRSVATAIGAEITLSNPTTAFVLNNPIWAESYAPNGQPAVAGEKIYRKRYANTLETIAQQGPDAFYKGSIADNIVKAAKAQGGIITQQDLLNYSIVLREPANITYRDHRIFATVAPSSGAIMLSALKVFEAYPGNATNSSDPAGFDLATHRLIQATRFAYGQRATLGDPAFTSNVTTLEKDYLLPETVAAVRALITDNATHPAPYYQTTTYASKFSGGTQNMVVIDKDGNAVSLTTTVNLGFGSRVITEDGVILNDEMDDFSSPGSVNSFGFTASPINFIRPGKRPQSSISSAISEDLSTGQVRVATGAAGGSRIITTTLQNLHYAIDFGLDPSAAVHLPRWHDQLTNVTMFEVADAAADLPGFSNRTTAYLTTLGYNVTFGAIESEGPMVIRAKSGQFSGAGDPRAEDGGASLY